MSRFIDRIRAAASLSPVRILLLGIIVNASAGEAPFRSPGDMTVDERTEMMRLVSEYNNCVYRESLARVDQFPDIRRAADAGMAVCEKTAGKLRDTIDGFRFEPGFAEQFVHHTRSRAVRALIPELALRKGGN